VGTSVRDVSDFMSPTFTRWNLTVSFRLPFYDGGRKAGLVQQAQSRVRTAEENLAQLQNNILLEVKAAYDDLQTFANAIQGADLTVAQAEKVLAMMQANFQYGAATTVELLDSQTALTVSRYSQLSATFDHEIAKARLRLASGGPILEQEKKP
jgi:outer membrane protein